MTGRTPLVSCIMPTANRRAFAGQAIGYFLEQDFGDAELVILDDGRDCIRDIVPAHPRIRYFYDPAPSCVGVKRNRLCAEARGDLIIHWDDDDWSAPRRIGYQARQLIDSRCDLSGLSGLFYYDPLRNRAWRYDYRGYRPWAAGNSLCYTKSLWKKHPFPEVNVGEDTRFVWRLSARQFHLLRDDSFLIAIIHDRNTSPKRTNDPCFRPQAVDHIVKLLGKARYFHLAQSSKEIPDKPPVPSPSGPAGGRRALVAAAGGVGDVIRVTPLIRVLHSQGFAVDVACAPDYAGTLDLLKGAPEISNCWDFGRRDCVNAGAARAALGGSVYGAAVFNVWAAQLKRFVKSERLVEFDRRQWLEKGDSYCCAAAAERLGWRDAMPAPFVVPSSTPFDLAPGTVALHPGCKTDWPWKRWNGFDRLSREFERVVVVGLSGDIAGMRQEWPGHVVSYIDRLNLADTAALLRRCACVVANDSGIMHLAAALGVPTFGIFGITDPGREIMPLPNMHVISKGLDCEHACRRNGWGRRNCSRNLRCLTSLSSEEVASIVRARIGRAAPGKKIIAPKKSGDDAPRLAYHGYVFDASGYGHAARAYVHAFHKAGIELTVSNISSSRGRQVRDDLVESLLLVPRCPDFHLFHGIPPQWAADALKLPNAIGMTVWETETMPSQWQRALNHCRDVWLPCDFNMAVFSRAIQKPLFKLPHAVFPAEEKPRTDKVCEPDFHGVHSNDFVFYSIFEWQERKSPGELIEAYLRAFTSNDGAVLCIKTNPASVGIARQCLETSRRRCRSDGRVVLFCEVWDEKQIEALHRRGDCYVSLHRGEGWGYPLFEAAVRGTPVIATGYSGPMEYLAPESHALVRFNHGSVDQRYIYYNKTMKWALPDLTHATQLMRLAFERPEAARERARIAAQRIQKEFSLEAIGALARKRLELLRQSTPLQRRLDTMVQNSDTALRPSIPIPASWYDHDYFETGRKSNWRGGYDWNIFGGLFSDTARMLVETFPGAESFLDVGCAKGLLVRALRQLGKECWGVDHSRWAIERADAKAAPFLAEGSVDAMAYERAFDIVTAFSIFESLSETQAIAFLRRARAWTGIAMVATIFTGAVDDAARLPDDRDYSHITVKSRKWWHDLFLRAGWRQDPLHRVVQSLCQNHELSRRMGWQMYVYAP